MDIERYQRHVNAAVEHVLDVTREVVPPHFKRFAMLELRIELLDAIMKKLQAARDTLDGRLD